MRIGPIAAATIAGLCLAGCGSAPVAAPAPEPPAVVTVPQALEPAPPTTAEPTSADVRPTGEQGGGATSTGTVPSETETSEQEPEQPTSQPDTSDQRCGTITNKAGTSYRVYATRDSGSSLGCAESERVMRKYLSLPADQYEGSGRFASFEGYSCAMTPKDRQQATCGKQGLGAYITG
ncbi:hypothetical protein ACL03H_17860 [Saccharopolyspora sp. MS10]|uniref:hypothetical protein n=1 Tax=Saccharopolyspora sp. MS10 TaxID=3385973 RepID=UPI0039A02D31